MFLFLTLTLDYQFHWFFANCHFTVFWKPYNKPVLMANVLLRKPKSYVKWSKGRIGNDFFRSVSTHYTFALVTWIDTCIRLHNDNRFFSNAVVLWNVWRAIVRKLWPDWKKCLHKCQNHTLLFIQSENYMNGSESNPPDCFNPV